MLISSFFTTRRRVIFFACLSALFSINVQSQSLVQLAQDPQWLDLLHYHRVGVNFEKGSQVDDERFFLSTNGDNDPLAELEATLGAFRKTKEEQSVESSEVSAAQCRFPARLVWLKKKMPKAGLVDADCPEFKQWFDDLNGEKLFLVFPAAYLNSPSSMYGHTLFRVKKRGNDNPLLDSAVNFAANTDPNDNELVFTYKGLTGGYPGVASVMPYYLKVKEYSFLESRDIWEYELNLTQDELDQFLRHIWEVREAHFDYYFFSENCSYQLLTLLDAAVDNTGLADDFTIWAIPVDTVRTLGEKGLLEEASYRPSVMNRMNSMLEQLTDRQVSIAKTLVESPELYLDDLAQYPEYDQTRILEMAYEYSRYLSARKKSTLSHLSGRSIKLLSLRSKKGNKAVFSPVSTPAKRDDEGHRTQRVAIGLQTRESNTYARVEYRPSYHDVLDPSDGYLIGAELSMLGAALRVDDDFNAELDYLNFVNIVSMSPRNTLVKPKSWKVNASLLRDIRTPNDSLVFNLQGGIGATYKAGGGILAGFLNASSSLDGEYDKDYLSEVGAEVLWVRQSEKVSFTSGYQIWGDTKDLADKTQVVSFGVGFSLDDDLQIRGEAELTTTNHNDWLTSHLSVLYYF